MKRLIQGVALLSLGLAMPAAESSACGDKFLVIGRATRRVPRAKNPAAILLAMNPQGPGAEAVRAMKLEATLKQAGHSVETLDQAVGMAAGLASKRYDFVVTDLDAAAAAARHASLAPSRPTVIPVAMDAAPAEWKAAEKEFVIVIPAPSRSVGYLRAIDTEMARRRAVAAR